MIRYILFIALTAGLLLATFPKEVCGIDPVNEQNSDVSLTITKFQLNDQTLDLTYKIKNDSDHDVWICDSIDTHPGLPDFEVFLAGDNQTLVIRRMFDLDITVTLEGFLSGRYVRLRVGEERDESLTIQLPASHIRYFEAETGRAEYARNLALEIGFYDEDLRELILKIVDIEKKLNCTDPLIPPLEIDDIEIRDRYFEELVIARAFNRSSYFKESVESEGEEILIPHMEKKFNAEKVLRITINNVNIPIRSVTSVDESQSETESTSVTMALTRFDVNDTHLELSWKIKNNSNHDVWICDRLFPGDFFEWFLDADDETLVIRKRFNLPQGRGWEHLPRAYYIRLCPGHEKVDSISLSVPVSEHFHFGPLLGHGQSATRMALEIGFYDEDLPGLILQIVEMAENLNCDVSLDSPVSPSLDPDDKNMELSRRFFPGVFIARFFSLESFTYFRNSVISRGEEIIIPYLYQTLNDEQVLRAEVNGLSIPLQRQLSTIE